ncbi:MAG: transposase [Methylococcales bacterium]|nr:transposase [Methylococcales bacterium]
MKVKDLQVELNVIDQETAQIESSVTQSIVKKLLNIIERLAGEHGDLKNKLQELNDEIARLKGEQGKPDIKANKKKDGDLSSEAERREAEANANNETVVNAGENKKRRREAKLPKIKIDCEQICPLDKNGLPDDLIFKGYEELVIQDLMIITNNTKYRREVFYSPSQHKSYRGELPDEVRGQGEYGPGIRALIPILKAEGNLSEKRILGFFQNFGIEVSPTYISQQWTEGYALFHQEKSDLYRSGISASDFVQIDDTSARVNGTNQYCQVVCSPLFTAYFTTPNKDRLSVLSVLTDFMPPQYLYNQPAKQLLDTFKLADKTRAAIDAQLPSDVVMNEGEFKAHLALINTLGIRQSVHLTEACAIAFYRQQTDFPVINRLLADDAPQFKLLTLFLGLCWIHDARHYKKLNPVIPAHQRALTDFRSQYWAYYTELLKYKCAPTPNKKDWLSKRFDELFGATTDYEELNDRIAKTLAKKIALLQVLELPQLPLHNNEAELGARVQARVRDVSFQTRSEKGTKIKDTFLTINQTAKKLGVSFYDYVYDKVTGQCKLLSLAELITQQAQLMPS